MFHTLFADWDFPPVVCSLLALVVIVYTAGFLRIRRTRPLQFPDWRWASFVSGVLALVVAVSSPLDTFSDKLLSIHMAQHFVLMSVAPPLIVLGAPVVPMLRGLPRWFVRPVLGPCIRQRWLRGFFHALVRPKGAWLLMNLAYIAWHVPGAYEAALANENIHNCEHACFFFTSVLFWWPVIEPWPSRFRGSRWILLPYLLAADIVNTGVSASLVFAGRVIYPSYAMRPMTFGLTPLQDQAAAGAFMWVLGSIVFLIPAFVITMQLLSSKSSRNRGLRAQAAR
ncbi:MAG TPA: cytochrome c oxidase assembly protein [Acidobacteriaceae bacterium]|nr:cytochrome c oxidase assembly protein [Acidobacteriaceae bacterium]